MLLCLRLLYCLDFLRNYRRQWMFHWGSFEHFEQQSRDAKCQQAAAIKGALGLDWKPCLSTQSISCNNWSFRIPDFLASASSSHKNENEEELQIKAVQESMLQWKIRSSKHRQKRQANVVCYGDLGCFEDSGPFGYIDMLPQSPEEIDTKFYVFSTKNRFVDDHVLESFCNWKRSSC